MSWLIRIEEIEALLDAGPRRCGYEAFERLCRAASFALDLMADLKDSHREQLELGANLAKARDEVAKLQATVDLARTLVAKSDAYRAACEVALAAMDARREVLLEAGAIAKLRAVLA